MKLYGSEPDSRYLPHPDIEIEEAEAYDTVAQTLALTAELKRETLYSAALAAGMHAAGVAAAWGWIIDFTMCPQDWGREC